MKKILLVCVLVFLTGCNVTYDLKIDENSISEVTSIIEKNSVSNYERLYTLYDVYLPKPIPLSNRHSILSESDEKIENVPYYDKIDLADGDNFGIKFSGLFDDIPISESNVLFFGVGNAKYSKTDDQISISVPAGIKAFKQFENLGTVTINITSKYKVLDHNADEVKDRTYTWVIDRSNYKNKDIEISFKTNNKLSESDSVMLKFTVIMASIVVVAALLYFIFRYIFNKKNSI